MKRLYTLLLLVMIGILSGLSFRAVSQADDYKFHSLFIYNFTKYIQWPSSSGDFVIGVVGRSDIIPKLEEMAKARTVGSQKIVIKTFPTAASVDGCQMLFIPNSQSKSLEELKDKARKSNILIITETPGLASKGSNINFVLKEGKWKFELNKQATEDAGIKVSSELAKLAILIDKNS
jgi:hypothetical protein